jgi:protocatechuate 3,4-dioxygenase beta subunit
MQRGFVLPTRRRLLAAGALAITGLAAGRAGAEPLVPTPACHDGDEPTVRQTEGPYFKAGSPQRTNLVEIGVQGTRLTLTGYVLSRSCQPIANVKLDFWQADGAGNYDNGGYRLRGYQLTDAQGRYTLETVIPGLYPGRTEHIHFKAQAPGKPELTSQLYFPGVAQNRSDGIYDEALLIDLKDGPSGTKLGGFNIILNV